MVKSVLSLVICLPFYFGNIQVANSKSTVLYGTCSDNEINEIKIISFSEFWWNSEPPIILDTGHKLSDNSFLLQVEIVKPQKVQIQIHGQSWSILISPDDSIHFVISHVDKEYDISFSGKNSASYNYYNKLSKVVRPNIDDPQFEGDIKAYQEKERLLHTKKMQFLNHYIATNQVTSDFKWFAFAESNYERAVLLYRPLHTGKLKIQDIHEGYFDEINSLEWNNERLLNVARFNVALVLRNIYCFTENHWGNFDKILDNINQSFTGKIREYLICSMIDIYAKKQLENYHAKLLGLIQIAGQQLADSAYIEQVAKSKVTYLMLNKPFPKDILTTTYLKEFNTSKKLKLEELLEKHEGKAIYIDFWASWCGPCRIDISESEPAKEYLKSKDVIVIYISIDRNKDEVKWRKATTQDRITQNQYLLENGLSSPLASYLNIGGIPRYLLLNQNHFVHNVDAPRINQNNFLKLKSEVSKMQQDIVTFK